MDTAGPKTTLPSAPTTTAEPLLHIEWEKEENWFTGGSMEVTAFVSFDKINRLKCKHLGLKIRCVQLSVEDTRENCEQIHLSLSMPMGTARFDAHITATATWCFPIQIISEKCLLYSSEQVH